MRRLAALSLCLSALACNQATTTSAVSIPGPNSLAVAGRSLLIASTAGDELRALDLSVDPRSFVRAPNPLFPLAIPTAPFPRAVAAYTAVDGTTAPFAFALSTAGGQVNVVSTASLATLGAVVIPDTSLALAVTKPDGQDERLVIAVTQGENGSLWTARFPATLKDEFTKISDVQPSLEVLLGVSSPQALAASPSEPNIVAVGDRLTEPDGLGRTGGLAICNLGTGTVVRLDVGGPVMALSFDLTGNRLFGLLDAEACGSEHPCNGMFRVDMTDPAAPKLAGSIDIPATARGLAVGGAIVVTLATAETATIDPLVITSATDGSLYAFDGARMVPASNPATEVKASVLYKKVAPDGKPTPNPTDGPVVFGADNSLVAVLDSAVVRSESLTLTWEGAIVQGRAGRIAGSALQDPAFDFAALGVLPGDLVVFGAESQGTCTKDADGEVKAKVATASSGRLELTALATGCLNPTGVFYAVRAPGAYVAIGSRSGVHGRGVPGTKFSGAGVSFDIPASPLPARDTQYVLSLISAVPIFSVPLGSSVMLPGAVAYDPVRMLFYAAYPGGNAVVELKPTEMRAGDAALGVVAYH
ncbi:MAG TPA: hypothetical protein VGK67_37690 [Myxococcales bacterium]